MNALPVKTTTWCVRTVHADGSVCAVVVATYRRALARLEAAGPGERVTVSKVGHVQHDAEGEQDD